MRTVAIATVAALLWASSGASPATNWNGSVSTPNSEVARHQPVVTDAGSLASTNYVDAATNAAPRGVARPLPPYLHFIEVSSSYPEDAEWFYENHSMVAGGCSARWWAPGSANPGVVERNFDFPYDESAEFVVRTLPGPGRLASISVARAGSALRESDVVSGRWSRYYRCLPGLALDGVNSAGVFAEMNVCATNGAPWERRGARDLNGLGAVRWVLDNAASAADAAGYVARHAYVPEATKAAGYSLHYMVCDRSSAWIVEDGVASNVTASSGCVVMTNFRRLAADPASQDPFGTGFERHDLLAAGAPIEGAWFRAHAYTNDAFRVADYQWPTEFAGSRDSLGPIPWTATARLQAWAKSSPWLGPLSPYARHPVERGGPYWQTVHSSRYDLESLTLSVAVQEDPTWYDFALAGAGSGGGVDEDAVSRLICAHVGAVDACELPCSNEFSVVGRIMNDRVRLRVYGDRLEVWDGTNAVWVEKEVVSASNFYSRVEGAEIDSSLGGFSYGMTNDEWTVGGRAVTGWTIDPSDEAFRAKPVVAAMSSDDPAGLGLDSAIAVFPDSVGVVQRGFDAAASVRFRDLPDGVTTNYFCLESDLVAATGAVAIASVRVSDGGGLAFGGPGPSGTNSIAFGTGAVASAPYSQAFGTNVVASAPGAFASGIGSKATKSGAHAEGSNTLASGEDGHAEGRGTTAAIMAHAEGNGSKATGSGSHAEGLQTEATGRYAHAEGSKSVAAGQASHAAGVGAMASGYASWAWNGDTNVSSYASHGDGTFNVSPLGGPEGFFIGETSLVGHVEAIVSSATNVLAAAVTNEVALATNVLAAAVTDEVAQATNGLASADWVSSNAVMWTRSASGSSVVIGTADPARGSGTGSLLVGTRVSSTATGSIVGGSYSRSDGTSGVALGNGGVVQSGHANAFVWSGTTQYKSKAAGTFNVNPAGGPDGLWVGDTNLADHVRNLAPRYVPSADDGAFSNAVVAAAAGTYVTEAVTNGILESAIGHADAATNGIPEEVAANLDRIMYLYELHTGTNGVAVCITNYESGAYSPDYAKLTIREVRGTNEVEIYNSHVDITNHISSALNNPTNGVVPQIESVSNFVEAVKADKNWQKYCSDGTPAPTNMVVISTPSVMFSAGYAWVRAATATGSLCFLASSNAPAMASTDTPSSYATFGFRHDLTGSFFGYRLNGYTEIGVDTDSIVVDNAAHTVTMSYDVVMSGYPILYYRETLNGDPSDPATWTVLSDRTGSARDPVHVVTWLTAPDDTPKTCMVSGLTETSGFFRASAGGGLGDVPSLFETNMPVDGKAGYVAEDADVPGAAFVVKPFVKIVGTDTNVVWKVVPVP